MPKLFFFHIITSRGDSSKSFRLDQFAQMYLSGIVLAVAFFFLVVYAIAIKKS